MDWLRWRHVTSRHALGRCSVSTSLVRVDVVDVADTSSRHRVNIWTSSTYLCQSDADPVLFQLPFKATASAETWTTLTRLSTSEIGASVFQRRINVKSTLHQRRCRPHPIDRNVIIEINMMSNVNKLIMENEPLVGSNTNNQYALKQGLNLSSSHG